MKVAVWMFLFFMTIDIGAADVALTAAEVAARSVETDQITAWKGRFDLIDRRAGSGDRHRNGVVRSRMTGSGADTQRLYRFSEPNDVKGTTLLVHEHGNEDDDIWLYLPSLGKPRRIAVSGKKSSFVGTQYEYADLMTFEHLKYRHTFVSTEECNGGRCWIIESTPKTENYSQDIGYSKLRSWITQAGFRLVRVDYFDMAGQPYKSQILEDYTDADPQAHTGLAKKRTMNNLRTGEMSEIRLSNVEYPKTLTSADFSPRRLVE